MKKKLIPIIIVFIILVLISIYFIFIRNTSKTDGINNIKEINDIIKINVDDINGVMNTVHTTNMVHAANKEIKKEYNFSLKNNDDNIEFYLDNNKSIIKKDNIYKLFNINDIDKCKTNKDNNKYSINCNDYIIDIYYSKMFKKYIKSIVKYDSYEFIYTKNNLEIKNDNIKYKYNIISEDNYKLEIITKDDNINVYYSNGSYVKYSVSYKDNNFNIIKKDDSIIISIPCNVDKYINLEITITNSNSNNKNNDLNYNNINFDDLLKIVLNEQIYNMFK